MKSLQEIQTELKDNQEFQAMDVHQAILDIGYAYWQNPEERTVDSYLGMINFVKENYGELFAVSILLGKYNQQVCNGGIYNILIMDMLMALEGLEKNTTKTFHYIMK